MKNPKKFDIAKKYNHPMGAIIWVNLSLFCCKKRSLLRQSFAEFLFLDDEC